MELEDFEYQTGVLAKEQEAVCMITWLEGKTTRAGGKMLAICVKIISGEDKGHTFFQNYNYKCSNSRFSAEEAGRIGNLAAAVMADPETIGKNIEKLKNFPFVSCIGIKEDGGNQVNYLTDKKPSKKLTKENCFKILQKAEIEIDERLSEFMEEITEQEIAAPPVPDLQPESSVPSNASKESDLW